MNNNDFGRFFIGYDQIVEKLASIAEQSTKLIQNYPPFNIKKITENKYTIEVALAGFTKQDIEIELEGGKLTIKGNLESKEVDEQFVFKGISNKAFTRQFTLADNVEIEGAELSNGMLKIWLEALSAQTKKKKIDIKESKQSGFKNAI